MQARESTTFRSRSFEQFLYYGSNALGTDHQKSYGGGGEFSNRRNFFSLSNSLYDFFLGH